MRILARIFPGLFVSAVCFAMATPPEALRWLSYREPVFPAQLEGTIVKDGFATVVFTFDDAGEILDRVVLAASHPAFTAAVLEVIPHWRIDTAGLASFIRRETIRFDFGRRQFVVSLSQRDASKSAFSEYGDEVATALRTVREGEIDAPLKMATQVAAIFPDGLKARPTEGSATVSFVVDGLGRVRVPAVTDASLPEFGEAALAAVKQWTFVPARHRGLPVQVMVERTVRFQRSDGVSGKH